MSRPPNSNKVPTKDMYWFAHGGIETSNEKCLNQRNTTSGDCEEDICDSSSPLQKSLQDRRSLHDDQKSPNSLNSVFDSGNSSGPSSLEMKEERSRMMEKRLAVEERRKQIWEAEQERNDAMLRKHMERDAALEARRNAQRSHIAFAFGSSVPRNVEPLQCGDSDKISRHSPSSGLLQKEENHNTEHLRRSVSPFSPNGYRVEVDASSPQPNSSQSNLYCERKTFSPSCWLVGSGALIGGDDVMSKSMSAAVPAQRGRRKNDLMPTVPYDRTSIQKSSTTTSTRKRSVSMTRLDQLAQPRRHYVEANKANSTASSGASSMLKDAVKSPTRPLSSASEQSGGSGRMASSVTRRMRSSPRKPRPVSIAGTVPDSRPKVEKLSPVKKIFAATKKAVTEVKKAKSIEKAKSTPRPMSATKPAKPPAAKQPPALKTSTPKMPTTKKTVTNKKKADIMVSAQPSAEVTSKPSEESVKPSVSPSVSPLPDNATSEAERNNAKRIISEEEAKTALAEKRRLAREQAEKEAELERQRQEELRLEEEERLRLEEEEQKKMEEEQIHLLEEHRKLEEEKLKKAIEENERKEEEERTKREEDQRLKAEQERKALEEAEKQRIELEEKLRKEEEERAERKKRLEKIMSRTRGKSSGTSPSGSISGSDQLDSGENQQENLSSGANSLDSNAGEVASGPASLEGHAEKLDPVSDGASMEANPTYEVGSDNESLNDIIMPKSETASQDNSLVILPENYDVKVSEVDVVESQLEDNSMPKNEVPEELVESAVEVADAVLSENITSFVIEDDIPVQSDENIEKNSEFGVIDKETKNLEDSCDVETTGKKLDTNVEVIESVSFQAFVDLDATPVISSNESETAIINEAEVVLSFEDDIKKNEDEKSIDSNVLLPDVSPPSEQAGPGEIEQNSHFSTSSDIKLPDPIYETSDDGSVSSERHHQDTNFGFQYEEHQESQHMTDEVFNEREILYSEETNFNPFEQHNVGNPSSHLMAAYESQFDIGGMQDSIYAYETSNDALSSVVEQPRELGDENVYQARLSTSSIPQVKEDLGNEENKENVTHDVPLTQMNPFANTGSNFENVFDDNSDKENVQFDLTSGLNDDILPEHLNLENNKLPSADSISNSTFLVEDSVILEQKFENQSIINKSPVIPSENQDFSNVTIIKAEGSNDCIGIISSVENDHISNDLVQNIQNEQLKSNFEYSSITDSEESSLDSNLSQVMTAEVNDQNSVDLQFEKVSSHSTLALKNDQAENPFSESTINGSSDSKSNGDHYSEREFFSNGHRIESSGPVMEQMGDFVQLDGNHISSVDHSTTNIFDNVDAVEFGKKSPDPFLLKGNSNPISGNPFLLQDDSKQVLVTPDLFN